MKHRALAALGAAWTVLALWGGGGPFVSAGPEDGVSPPASGRAAAKNVGFLLPAGIGPNAKTTPYDPHPGDILLYDEYNRFHHLVYSIAGTGPPTHAAMVVEGDKGQPALLELTGSTVVGAKVVVMDVAERLYSYSGSIWVRRLRRTLTPDESAALTSFAREQQGKCFACGRIVLQVTPFRPRTYSSFAHTYFHRHRWICSEMVVAAACTANILDPKVCAANAMYPRDLAFDERYDLSAIYEPAVSWVPLADSLRPNHLQ